MRFKVAQMRRNGFTLVELLIVAVVIVALAAFVWPAITRKGSYRNAHRSSCQSNLKQIGLGFAQYIQDWDDFSPPISVGNQGWAESLQPYLKSELMFQCPSVNNSTKNFSSDYFLNARSAGLQKSKINFPEQTIVFGEGSDNSSTNSHFSELPFEWKSSENSPAKRHLGGANYGFVDGHVKWFMPQKLTGRTHPRGGKRSATFVVR
jgi:prepilin-type processing-associated H-X9-DG protein/prepilin-type N-terminal cleavage/methylation domain-containing protein